VIAGTGASFYDVSRQACHLDLIPYATGCKWTDLKTTQRSKLLKMSGDALACLLRDSAVRILILNGRSVVDHFQQIAGVPLYAEDMPTWSLPRQSTPSVVGVAYQGIVRMLAGVVLGRDVLVLGYNHNVQSSYGVTRAVVDAIRTWISSTSAQVLG
jgi:hypothetical protein